jgi:hypothetical protein
LLSRHESGQIQNPNIETRNNIKIQISNVQNTMFWISSFVLRISKKYADADMSTTSNNLSTKD